MYNDLILISGFVLFTSILTKIKNDLKNYVRREGKLC